MSDKYLIAGGDMRFSALAGQLAQNNDVTAVGFDRNIITSDKVFCAENIMSVQDRSDYLVLPIPPSNDGFTLNTPFYRGTVSLKDLPSALKENAVIFGGKISPSLRELFTSKKFEVYDYLEREELSVFNARATAEGAVQIALEEQAVTLADENILIIGMGRISRALIRILSGFGTHITVAARKYSELAWAEIYGCKVIHLSELKKADVIGSSDLIFNTIPAMILDKQALEMCSKSTLIIDLASKPGGMNFEAAAKLGLRAIWALALPGKTAPISAGMIIGKAIENILKERINQ